MIPSIEIPGDSLDALMFYIAVLGALLLLGTYLRAKIMLLRKLYVPAALVAGTIGFALGPYGLDVFHREMVAAWSTLPGRLITLVFAPMLMGVVIPNPRKMIHIFGPQAMFTLGGSMLQIAVPFILTAILFVPYWDVDPLFGAIIELGFCGGHGTAGGMMEVFRELGWPDGGTLALMTATAGLFLGIFSGIIIINYGVRKGYTSVVQARGELKSNEDDLIVAEKPRPGAMATTNKSIIESFAFHGSLIGIAVLIGWFLQRILSMWIRGMPLFPLAMIGGLVVQLVIVRTPWAVLVDRRPLQGIQGMALEFLIVAAIASIRAPVVLAYAAPLTIIVAVTTALMVIYFFWAGKRLFHEHWFENALVAYGSLTGMAAVGLMLLRTVDPEMKTNAGVAYALRGPFISPIVGGGILSASLPIIIVSYGVFSAGLFFLGVFAALIVLCKTIGWWGKPAGHPPTKS